MQKLSKIRVLSVINDLYFGGDENRLLSFAKTIDRNRFEHTVVCIKKADPELEARYGAMRNQFAEAGIPIEELGKNRSSADPSVRGVARLTRAISVGWNSVQALSRLIRNRNIDIVDAHIDPGGMIGVLAAAGTRRRRVFTTYHPEPLIPPWEPLLMWRARKQMTFCMADAVVTDSDARRDDLRRQMICKRVPVAVIPNGMAPPASTRATAEVRALLNLPQNGATTIIGQVSSLKPHKGHKVLLEAARLVLERADAYFIIIGYARGDDAYVTELQEQARAFGIADRVRIAGYPGAIGDVWQIIDIHAHASLIDSLPNAIIESMSLAKPAVVTSVGGIPTMVEHGRTGLVVPPNDARALADALLILLNQPNLGRPLGQAAFARYQERYTPEVMTRRLEDLFTGLCRPE